MMNFVLCRSCRVILGTLLLLFFLNAVPAHAVEWSQPFKSPEFTLYLPQDWCEIPREALDQAAASMAKAGGVAPRMDYGYQKKGAGRWLAQPYIIIQVKNTGRVSESQLEKYATLPATAAWGFAAAKLGETLYDARTDTLLTLSKTNVPNGGAVVITSVLHLTAKGGINLAGYCSEAQAESFVPFFREAGGRLIVAPDLQYRVSSHSKAAESTEDFFINIAAQALVWAVIIGAVLFFVSAKRKSAKAMPAASMIIPTGRSGWAIAAGYLALFTLIILPAPLTLLVSLIAIWDIRVSRGTASPKAGMGRAIFGLIVGALGTAALGFIIMDMYGPK